MGGRGGIGAAGAMLRSMGRVMGGGGGGGGGSGGGGTPFTKSSNLGKARMALASSLCEDQQIQGGGGHPLGQNEWELCGDDMHLSQHGDGYYYDCAPDRVVFGSFPTKEEVEDALWDLKDVFPSATSPPLPDSSSQCSSPGEQGSISRSRGFETSLALESVQQNNNSGGAAESLENITEPCKTVVDWIEPVLHPCNYGVVQPLGRNNVLDAFQLLKNNPTVQGMVISLASDKAIWDAVLKNEKVEEFRKSLQKGDSKLEEITGGPNDASAASKLNLFTQAVENVKLKVTEYMEKITELLHHILVFADKKFFAENDGDILDRTIKSSLMLSIAVLLVVIVKRAR